MLKAEEDDPFPSVWRVFLTENSRPGFEGFDAALLERAASHLATLAEHGGAREVGLYICGEEEMAELHGEFMNDPTPTDVMAFEADEEDEGYLGDVIVCDDVAKTVAQESGNLPLDELYFYVIHGILHLMGFDDSTPEQREDMHRLQRQALESEGVKVA